MLIEAICRQWFWAPAGTIQCQHQIHCHSVVAQPKDGVCLTTVATVLSQQEKESPTARCQQHSRKWKFIAFYPEKRTEPTTSLWSSWGGYRPYTSEVVPSLAAQAHCAIGADNKMETAPMARPISLRRVECAWSHLHDHLREERSGNVDLVMTNPSDI